MNSTAEGVYKNLRYRILHTNNKSYLVDMDRPFLVLFFPFIYWLFSQKVYLLENPEIVNALKVPQNKQVKGKVKVAPFLGAGISVFIANVIRPFTDYFDLSTTWVVNSIILCLLFSTMIFLRCYMSKLFKDKIQTTINLAELPTELVRIRPKSVVNILQVISYYFFFGGFIFVMTYASVKYFNTLSLIFFIIFLSFFLVLNALTVMPGDYKVTFKNKK